MTVEYDKPFMTVPEQIAQLRANGMQIEDDAFAEHILSAVGYYRFSGYSYGFRQFPSVDTAEVEDEWQTRLSQFEPVTTFESVHQIYEFDRQTRMRVFDGIEKFEIAFRFLVGHLLAQSGTFAHRDPATLDYEFTKRTQQTFIELDGSSTPYQGDKHTEWLAGLNKQEARSQEAFALHHRNKYGGALPLWKSTEVMSFGTLIRLYGGMKQQHREQIAADLDVLDQHGAGDSNTFSNWLNHIRYIRNTCAHHSRLWNRNLDVILVESRAIPELAHLAAEQRSHLYGTVVVLSYLLARTHPQDNWRDGIKNHLLDGAARLGEPVATMGFPTSWESELIWGPTYGRDELRASRVRLAAQFRTLTSGNAVDQLHSVEKKRRKSQLTYLRNKHALIGLKLGATYQYPAFQFDSIRGNVFPLVVEINRRIYVSNIESSLEELPWISADWWVRPCPELRGTTPLQALESGSLSWANVDHVIPGSAEDPIHPSGEDDLT
jgi:abortive infection bacteriophage resistance protein